MRGSGAIFGAADATLVCTPGRDPNQLRIEATFKRAKAWTRTIQMAAYENLGTIASEVLDELDRNVLAFLKNTPGLGQDVLTQVCKTQGHKVRDSLQKLRRNVLVVEEEGKWRLA